MRLNKKICIFALLCALLITVLSISVLATDVNAPIETETVESIAEDDGDLKVNGKLPMNLKVDDFGKRLEIVLEGFVTGMLAVFAILALLWGIVSLSKVFLHDIPNAKRNKKSKKTVPAPAPAVVAEPAVEPEPVDGGVDDGELAAVITAAVAAMIESGDYKDEFANGFRVVQFKRSAKNAWNRK
ncbi:MAG: OadG family protein [Clostridia bacterium]|nr:OadG family protein [Clostridia bacterium]